MCIYIYLYIYTHTQIKRKHLNFILKCSYFLTGYIGNHTSQSLNPVSFTWFLLFPQHFPKTQPHTDP